MATARLCASGVLGAVGLAVFFGASSFLPVELVGYAFLLASLGLLGRRRTMKAFAEEARDILVPVIIALAVVAGWYYKTGQIPYARGAFVLLSVLWASAIIGRIRDRRGQQRLVQVRAD